MDTFELLPVLAAGDLSQTSAPELVAAIYRSRASGTLSLEGEGREEIRLFFRMGDSCGATRPAGFRSLGEILTSQQMLTPDQVERASADASTSGKKLGEVLLASGVLNTEQLHAALAAQHRENLRLLLLRNVGGYEWRGWEPPPPWAAEVSVDPTRPILEALSLPQLTGRRQAVLRWLLDSQVRASLDFAELAARAELLVADRRAAELFARPKTPEAFLRASGLPQARAEALLVTLLLLGGVEPVPPAAAQPLDASSFEPHPPPAPPDFELSEVPPPLPPLEVDGDEIEEALDSGEHAVPQAPRFAPTFDVDDGQDLGAELAAELHADLGARAVHPMQVPVQRPPPAPPPEERPRARELPEPDPLAMAAAAISGPEDVVDEYELEPIAAAPELIGAPQKDGVELSAEIFAREEPMELVHDRHVAASVDPFQILEKSRSGAEVMDDRSGELAPLELDLPPSPPTLDDQRSQAQDDEQARAVRKRLLGVGLRNLGAFTPPNIEGGEAAARELRIELRPEPLSEADVVFLRDVHKRAQLVPGQDAYARLGVARTATQDQIRAAYLALVKRFHPDTAQAPKFAPALPDLEVLFGALRDAYECIGSPEARADYEASARTPTTEGGRRAPSPAEEAQLSLKKGEVHLKRRDYEAALRELRRAVDLDPSPEALTALGWALCNDRSQGPAGREEALKLVARALKLDKDTARAHYVAGVLKRTSEPDAALEHFRAAVSLDPRNGDAALEMRLLERRREKKPITGPLSRLFKRDGK